MSKYRQDQPLLFQIETPRNIDTEMQEARDNIKQYIIDNPGKNVNVAFSCGKDSLLTALLVREVLDNLHIDKRINLNVFYSGYEKKEAAVWFKHLRETMTGVQFRVCKIHVSHSYGVCVLGRGRFPISAYNVKWCNQLKRGGLDLLQRTSDGLTFVGVRASESIRRAKDIKENGVIRGTGSARVCRPIGNVSTCNVWKYLERNVHNIGVNYDRLVDYYGNDTRDGCWFCYAQKYPNGENDLRSAITLRWRKYSDYERMHKGFYCWPNGVNRIRTDVLRERYNEVIELEKKYNEYLLTDMHKKYIFEFWNIYENVTSSRGKKGLLYKEDFLRDYFNGSYKMLYPELFDDALVKIGDRYLYRKYIIEQN